MSARDVQELIVSVHPEGMDDTQDKLKETRQEFDETADDVGESTDMMSNFASQFKGAGIVFAGAFGTMIAAIASKMPIVEENFSALDAVLTAVGLRMDSLARDEGQTLTDRMFRLADLIATGEDDLRALAVAGKLAKDSFGELVFPLGTMLNDLPLVDRGIDMMIDSIKTLDQFLAENNPIDVLQTSFSNFKDSVAGIGSWLSTQFSNAKDTVIQDFVNPLIEKFNRLIELANQLPGVDVETLETIRTEPGQVGGPQPNLGPGPGEFGIPTGDGRSVKEAAPGIAAHADLDVNLDSRTVASATKEFNVRGTLSRGRGSLPGE